MLKVGENNETSRVYWIEDALRKIPSGARILDAGAGEQKYRRFCSHLKYVSQDFGKYDGAGDRHGLQMGLWDQNKLDIVSDIVDIPEPDASFDAILCVEVFEHLPEPLAALREFSRLLREGGMLILTAPFCSLTHFSPYHYSSGFNRYFYEWHLQNYCFDIIELQENGNYFEYLAQEVRRVATVADKYSGGKLTFPERLAKNLFLLALQRFSANDQGSSELLHFGCMVRAVRR